MGRIYQGSPNNSPQIEEAAWMSSETFQPNKKEVQLPWLNFQVRFSHVSLSQHVGKTEGRRRKFKTPNSVSSVTFHICRTINNVQSSPGIPYCFLCSCGRTIKQWRSQHGKNACRGKGLPGHCCISTLLWWVIQRIYVFFLMSSKVGLKVRKSQTLNPLRCFLSTVKVNILLWSQKAN